MLGETDLRKLSILLPMVFSRIVTLFAIGRWHGILWKAIYGDVVNGKIGNG